MRVTALSWLKFNPPRQDMTPAPSGGIVIQLLGAAALNVGDVVFFSAANKVNKSATAANYTAFAGVVRGGDATNMLVSDQIGAAACTGDDKPVLVQISGVATVPSTGTIAIGTHASVIGSGTTAGAVAAGTTAGQILGTTVTTAASNQVKILIRPR
jgi:hypothetical protein